MINRGIRILVAGSYNIDDGYPNVKWLLRFLERDDRLSVKYAGKGHVQKQHLSKSIGSRFNILFRGIYLVVSSLKELWVVLLHARKKNTDFDILYIPYPALPLLFLLSYVPSWLRPVVVADCFISVYDTLVNDRQVCHSNSFFARLLFYVEKRALRTADKIITDTECNSLFLQKTFSIEADKLRSIPLATDEQSYFPRIYQKNHNVCNILFVGTFVPLHGVTTIAHAMNLLSHDTRFRFHMFGDGQDAGKVKKILSNGTSNVEWTREWTGADRLSKEIYRADICLGIFGTTEKASRVWPLKNYLAMRVGRCIITQYTQCLPWLEDTSVDYPCFMIPPGDESALAEMLLFLVNHPSLMENKANLARRFYGEHLSNKKAIDALYSVFKKLKK